MISNINVILKMVFKASLDKTATVITVLCTLLFAFIIAILLLITRSSNTFHQLYICIILAVIYSLAFIYRPVSYQITRDLLTICRPISDVHIKKADIRSVAMVDETELNKSIRTFGVGGMFGYYGSFANYHLGSMTWYATRKDKAVLITTIDNKKIVVTPDEPEAFITALGVIS